MRETPDWGIVATISFKPELRITRLLRNCDTSPQHRLIRDESNLCSTCILHLKVAAHELAPCRLLATSGGSAYRELRRLNPQQQKSDALISGIDRTAEAS